MMSSCAVVWMVSLPFSRSFSPLMTAVSAIALVAEQAGKDSIARISNPMMIGIFLMFCFIIDSYIILDPIDNRFGFLSGIIMANLCE
jgi:hypothetical protein